MHAVDSVKYHKTSTKLKKIESFVIFPSIYILEIQPIALQSNSTSTIFKEVLWIESYQWVSVSE